MKRIALTALCVMMAILFAHAADSINLTGTYECNINPQSVKQQMHLTIDFVNDAYQNANETDQGRKLSE